jgi:hypothetical protein
MDRWPEHLESHLERVLGEVPIGMLAQLVFAYPPEQQETIINNLTELGHQWGIARIERWLTSG